VAAALLVVAGCGSSTRLAKTAPTTPSTSSTTSTVAPTTTAPPASTTTATVPRVTTTTRAPVAAASSGACASNLASSISNTYSARQLVTVESSSYGTDEATVTLWQKSGSCWQLAAGPWSGFIGYNGFAPPGQKHEGDGRTPTGSYGFGPVIYGNAPETYQLLDCGDWWDEDSSSPTYNTFQDLACNYDPPFDNGSSEALWKETGPYPSFAVIDYNTDPIVPGAGSAIFFHASTGGATDGCVSVPLSDLDWFLRWMEPSQAPLIVMGPSGEIGGF
jgi:L,D-peptidoglycan transpeptidase YkuD (ErfK/YbiS/YcfS/YnhG family)